MAKPTDNLFHHVDRWLQSASEVTGGAPTTFSKADRQLAKDITRLLGHIVKCLTEGSPLRDYATAVISARRKLGTLAKFNKAKKSDASKSGPIGLSSRFIIHSDDLLSNVYWLVTLWAHGEQASLFAVPSHSLRRYSSFRHTRAGDSLPSVQYNHHSVIPDLSGLFRVSLSLLTIDSDYSRLVSRVSTSSRPKLAEIDRLAAQAASKVPSYTPHYGVPAEPTDQPVDVDSLSLAELTEYTRRAKATALTYEIATNKAKLKELADKRATLEEEAKRAQAALSAVDSEIAGFSAANSDLEASLVELLANTSD